MSKSVTLTVYQILTLLDIKSKSWKMPKSNKGILPSEFIRFISKVNQVIYPSALNRLLNTKSLAYTRSFRYIVPKVKFEKGFNKTLICSPEKKKKTGETYMNKFILSIKGSNSANNKCNVT